MALSRLLYTLLAIVLLPVYIIFLLFISVVLYLKVVAHLIHEREEYANTKKDTPENSRTEN